MSSSRSSIRAESAGGTAGLPIGWLAEREWTEGGHVMRALKREDMEHLREWRNQQQAALRQQHPLTPEHQSKWFDTVVLPSYRETAPSALLVIVHEDQTPVGYGGLTNIDWNSRRAELSFLAATDRTRTKSGYQREFSQFLQWVCRVTFEEVRLQRLFAETWAFRTDHIAVLEQTGFVHEGTLRRHVEKDGRYHDALIHGLLDSDWRKHG